MPDSNPGHRFQSLTCYHWATTFSFYSVILWPPWLSSGTLTASSARSHHYSCYESPHLLLWVTSSSARSHHYSCYESPHLLLWVTSSSARSHHFSCYESPHLLQGATTFLALSSATNHPQYLAMSHYLLWVTKFSLNHPTSSAMSYHLCCMSLPSCEPPQFQMSHPISLYEPPVDKRPAALPLDFLVFWQNVFVSLSPQGSHVVSSLCIAGHLSYNRYCGRDRTFLICYQDLPCGKRL